MTDFINIQNFNKKSINGSSLRHNKEIQKKNNYKQFTLLLGKVMKVVVRSFRAHVHSRENNKTCIRT